MRHSTIAIPLLTTTLATPISTVSDTPLPVLLWHGLGDSYASDGINGIVALIQGTNPGTFVYPIRLEEDPSADSRASFFGNATDQIAKVCADIAKHPILSSAPALDALGFSQGGIFLRGYAQRCAKPPLRSLVTFGTPHNGISEFQNCADTDWFCKGWTGALKTNTWSANVQSHVIPAQYYRDIDPATGNPSDGYIESSNLLADLNNERSIKNKTYAKNLAELEKFVMYEFADDVTVIPKASEWFAEYNETNMQVTPLKKRPLYKEDWIGLKALDEKDGLVFKTVPGGHMQLEDKMLREAFKTYFGPARKNKSLAALVSKGENLEL
ncbi:alpha/beta-hydrolase [Tothia fuscella]|uniref:Palmitoyl-protein thioesterase 1 n=1 Tax=Tothia fuscella TaxID=1048955 RepID=A0A9P4NRP7_9PEZI|nr:alpha/beta-hydrolase [Tothia fuscella]